MEEYIFSNVIWQEDDQFVGLCLNLDISSYGETYKEAIANLNEAIELYLEDADSATINTVEKPLLLKHKITQNVRTHSRA